MDLRSYVRENQHIITFVHQATPGVIDKYVGTLDYATARFNTILLKLYKTSTRTYNDIDSGPRSQDLSLG